MSGNPGNIFGHFQVFIVIIPIDNQESMVWNLKITVGTEVKPGGCPAERKIGSRFE